MSKFATVVLSFCLVLPNLAQAKSDDDGGNRSYVQDPHYQMWKDEGCAAPDQRETPNCLALSKQIGGKDTLDDCSGADKAYTDAKAAFASACSGAGAPITHSGGSIACSEAVNKCSVCGMRQTDEGNSSGVQCPEGSRGSSGSGDVAAARLANASKLSKYCPAKLTAVDQEKLQNEFDKVEKEVKEDEKELPKIQQAALDAHNSAQKELDGLKDDAVKEEEDYQKQLKDVRRGKDQAQNQIQDSMLKLNQQISDLQDKIRQIGQARVQSQITAEQTRNKIELNCTSKAEMQVEQEQNLVFGMLKTNSYRQGGQATLFKKVGLSSREGWQQKARLYEKWCLQSKATVKSQEEAARILMLSFKQHDADTAAVNQRIADVKTQQGQLVGNACAASPTLQANGQSTPETQMCQAARQAKEDTDSANAQHSARKDALATKYQTAVAAQNAATQKAQSEAQQKQMDIAAEKTRFDNLKRYMDVIDKAGGATDPKAYKELQEKYGTFYSAAEQVVKCGGSTCEGSCRYAADFLKSINHDFKTEIADAPKADPLVQSSTQEPVSKRAPSGSATTPSNGNGDGSTPSGKAKRENGD